MLMVRGKNTVDAGRIGNRYRGTGRVSGYDFGKVLLSG